MNSGPLSDLQRQLTHAQRELAIARDALDLATERTNTLTAAIRAHLLGPRDLQSFVTLRYALPSASTQERREPDRYSVATHGAVSAAIIAERNDLRATLRAIQAWDCLNPPRADLLADLPWLKRLVDEALNPQAPPCEVGLSEKVEDARVLS